jgi:ATP-binding cassette subfamily B protein
LTLGVLYGSLVLGQFFFFSMSSHFMLKLVLYVSSDLRAAILRHSCTLPGAYIDQTPTGKLLSNVTRDADVAARTFNICSIVSELIGVAVASSCILTLQSRHGLVALVATASFLAIAMILTVCARRTQRRLRESVATLNTCIGERVSGLDEIRRFGRMELAERELQNANEETCAARSESAVYDYTQPPITALFGLITVCIVDWFAGNSVMHGYISLGTLVALVQYIDILFMSLGQLVAKVSGAQSGLAAIERLQELLEKREVQPTRAYAPAITRGQIAFEHVSFSYGGNRQVITDFSLSIEPGERVALVGLSGAGKSTIVKLLSRAYDVTSGRIVIDGVDVRQWDIDALRRTICTVHQEVHLFDDTIERNIVMSSSVTNDTNLLETLKRSHLIGLVEQLPKGKNESLGEGGVSLSVGQAQLISFARALYRDPRVLILDEAMSSLDSETETRVRSALEELLEGRTCLIIAHRLSTVMKSHRIGLLSNGKLAECGTHDQLMTRRGLYYNLFSLQFGELSDGETTLREVRNSS